MPSRRFVLIVSERKVHTEINEQDRVRFALHRLADAVVTNSEHGRGFLLRNAPWLAEKLAVILNGVDLDRFRAATELVTDTGETRVLVLARYESQKNPTGMLAAMEWLRNNAPAAPVSLDWYGQIHIVDGRPGPLARVYVDLQHAIRAQALGNTFRLHDAAEDVVALYRGASLVCLPSHYEGCSNVVCEALSSGVPVVASDVGDNRTLVIDGKTGFLCDPTVPRTIGEAILRFHGMPVEEKRAMGRRARAHAEALLAPERFVAGYADLVRRLVT